MEFLILVLFWSLLWGAISAFIGQRKNLSGAGSFCWGFFLGLIGLIVVIAKRPGLPEAPPGLYATKCTRCNAVQNVPIQATSFECWQCHLKTALPARTPSSPTKPPPLPDGRVRVVCPHCKAKLTTKADAKRFKCVKCDEVSLRVTCPRCGAKLSTKAEATRFKCAKCEEESPVPA